MVFGFLVMFLSSSTMTSVGLQLFYFYVVLRKEFPLGWAGQFDLELKARIRPLLFMKSRENVFLSVLPS
jgi:hypothetical protein